MMHNALFLAAMASARVPGPLHDTYNRLITQGKPPMRALGVIMRKLLVLMRAMLITGKPFNPRLITVDNS